MRQDPWRSGDRGYNGVFLGWNRAKGCSARNLFAHPPAGRHFELAFELAFDARTLRRCHGRRCGSPWKAEATKRKEKEEAKKKEESKKGTRIAGFHHRTGHHRRRDSQRPREPVHLHPAPVQGKVYGNGDSR